jgi:hypothetical protein
MKKSHFRDRCEIRKVRARARARVCVCVRVCMKEREREREKRGGVLMIVKKIPVGTLTVYVLLRTIYSSS